ncbi:MAG: hypothetical protein AB7N76_04345 [Planctomycetota bacterium]
MKQIGISLVLLGALLATTGCPDGTPGKETVRNSWEDMLAELKKMDEASMKKHWKRYYERAINELNTKVADLTKKKTDLLVDKKLAQKELDELEPAAKKAKGILQAAISKYKEQAAEAGRKSFTINVNHPEQEYDAAEAKQLLRKWHSEFKRKYADEKITVKVNLVKKLTDSVGKIEIAIDAYKDKVSMLEDQMKTYEAELELAKVRDSMNALCDTGKTLGVQGDIPSLDQLTALNKSLDKAIAKSEVQAELAKEETDLKAKFSSLESEVNGVGAGLEVGSELEKEISAIQ